MSGVSLLGGSRNWSCGWILLVDGHVCQTHKWMALLIMEILLGKEGVLCFREGFDGIVQRNGRVWSMDNTLFNFNDSIFS